MSWISIVRGYHGTILPDAQRIVDLRRISKRVRPYHWLGQGAYFFEDAPRRAWAWALYRARTEKEQPAVVSCTIILRNCLDLVDIAGWHYIRAAHTQLAREHAAAGGKFPQQQPSFYKQPHDPAVRVHLGTPVPVKKIKQNYNFLDCAVVDLAVIIALQRTGVSVASVRAPFLEGQKLYPNSYFFDRSHVQISVRDPGMISDLIIEDSVELQRRFGAPVF